MSGIDRLIAKQMTELIKNNLEEDVLRPFERRLFKKHGMSIKLSIEHYDKFNSTLKEYITNTEEFGKKCIVEILEMDTKEENRTITLKEPNLCNTIINYLGDRESRNILNLLFGETATIPEILEKCNLPKTSGYRKLENMIRDGIIIDIEERVSKSKKIFAYKCIFENLSVDFEKDLVIVEGIINKKLLEQSSIVRILELST